MNECEYVTSVFVVFQVSFFLAISTTVRLDCSQLDKGVFVDDSYAFLVLHD